MTAIHTVRRLPLESQEFWEPPGLGPTRGDNGQRHPMVLQGQRSTRKSKGSKRTRGIENSRKKRLEAVSEPGIEESRHKVGAEFHSQDRSQESQGRQWSRFPGKKPVSEGRDWVHWENGVPSVRLKFIKKMGAPRGS